MSNTTTHKHNTRKRGRPAQTDTVHAKRPKRASMFGTRLKMQLNHEELDESYHYAWINDTGDLIHQAKRSGYEHVTLDEVPTWGELSVDRGDPTSSIVQMPVGHGTVAYLMKQPMEFYEEDRGELDALTDAREADLKKSLNSGNDGTYGKVEIK